MLRAYKYKIKPNQQQEELLSKFFGCARYIYNWGLNIRTQAYKENGEKVSYVELAKQLTQLKKEQEYEWLNEVSVESLQQSLRNLDNAFTAFFRKKAKYPRFKSKKNYTDSVKFIQSVHFDLENWTVKLPKLGKVKLCKNKPFDLSSCKQGTCTVSRDRCGDYWCVITVDDLQPKPTKTKLVKETAVGIDLGIKDYAILSNGMKFPNPKHLKAVETKLSHIQKVLARSEKDSKNHENLRVKVAKLHRKVRNQRNDTIHKLTRYLVDNFDTMCLEDLNVDGMLKNHNLARAISDTAWSEFIRQLSYKCEWYGKNVLFIGRFDPSSKMCHECGYINKELKLSDREWTCPQCGTHLDRDVNAARNIKEIAFDRQNLIGI